MSDAIAYRIQNGTLYADVYNNGLFPGAVPSSLGSTYTYQWRVGTLLNGTYQFVDLVGASTNQVSALDPSKVYQVIAQQSGVVTTGSLFQFATQNISTDYTATLIGSNYVGVTGISLNGIFDGTSAGKYYSINNLTSVNYFTVDLISGKFQINGGDLIDLVNFGSYSNAASGIYFSPGNENGSYGSVYEVFLGNQSGINLGRLINVENIIGTPGSDYIDFVGNSFNHFIDAGQGDNNITTYGGSDTVVAGSGNDVISVGTGSAVVLAGGGSNLIAANDGSFFEITTGTGADAITVGNGLDASAVNHINAGAGDNNITAGNGAFAINTGTGDDWISVGTGSNTINLSSGAATVRAGNGLNQITASDGSSFQITTGSGADTISLGNDTTVDGINKVAAGDGQNIIEVGAGNYEITTGGSSDVITVRSSSGSDELSIYAGGGNNTISAISDTSGFEITTGIGADTITVGSNLDVSMASHINAGAGNNKLTAGNGAFVIDTGTGDDWISVGTGSNTINLSSGAATVSAGNGVNQITASDGSSFQITTGSGADTISLGNDTAVGGVNKVAAGDGENNIQVGSGNYEITTGGSSDVITVRSSVASDELTIYAGGGNNSISAISNTSGFEITTGIGADTITVGSNLDATAPSHLDAGGGANKITTGAGDFVITVGADNDTITLSSDYESDLKVFDTGGNNTIRAFTANNFDITTGGGDDNVTIGGTGNLSTFNRVELGGGDNTLTVGQGAISNTDHVINGQLSVNDIVVSGQYVDEIPLNLSYSGDFYISMPTANSTAGAGKLGIADGFKYSIGYYLGSTWVQSTSGEYYIGDWRAPQLVSQSSLDPSRNNILRLYAWDSGGSLSNSQGSYSLVLNYQDIRERSGDFLIHTGSGADNITVNSTYRSDVIISDDGGRNNIKAFDADLFDITTGAGGDTITIGNDIAPAYGGINKVSAGDGANIIQVGFGTYQISTGVGADVITVLASENSDKLSLIAGDGNNTITANSNTSGYEITTGTGADTITVGSNLDVTTASHIDAGGGANNVTVGSGDFTITVGSEDDTVKLNGDVDSDFKVFDSGGINRITSIAGNVHSFDINTGSGSDEITLGGVSQSGLINHINAGEGNNSITLGANLVNRNHVINGQLESRDLVVNGQYVDEIPLNLSYSGDFYISMPTALSMPAVGYPTGAGILGITNGFKYSIGYYSNSTWVQSASGQHIIGSAPLLISQNALDHSKNNILRLFAWDFGNDLSRSMGTYSLILNYQDQVIRSGDYQIVTGSGADLINISSALGSDLMVMDAGGANTVRALDADHIEVTTGNDADSITVGNGLDGSFVNHINAGAGNNSITAGNGAFAINTGTGDDWISVGTGSNTINLSSGAATVRAGNGVNQITASDGSSFQITTGSGADTISLGNDTTVGGINKVAAGDGQNIIEVGSGNYEITTGGSSDVITVRNSAGSDELTIYAGGGNNTISAISNTSGFEITTGIGADTITVGSNLDVTMASHINAGAGSNKLTAGNGAFVIDTGTGDDWISVGTGSNTINLSSGAATVSAGNGANQITASDGLFFNITTGAGNDTISLGNLIKPISLGFTADSFNSMKVNIGGVDITLPNYDSHNNISEVVLFIANALAQSSIFSNFKIESSYNTILITPPIGAEVFPFVSTFDMGGQNLDMTVNAPSGFTYVNGTQVWNGQNPYASQINLTSSISVGDGDNNILVGDGGFLINGGTGSESITVGSGSNTINLSSGAATVRAGNGVNQITASDGSSFQITTGSGADTISLGNDTTVGGINKVAAGDGQNIIEVGSGNYEITTGGSSDVITVRNSAGSDELTIYAGGGNNTISAISNTSGFEITTGIGADTITVGSNLDVTTASHIDAGAGANKITTGAGDFWVTVGSDADDITLNSAAGSDLKVVDSGGANTIRAQAASSFEITTGSGNDTITLGNDTAYDVSSVNHVSAGEGQNIVQVGSGSYVISAGDSADVITALSSAISDELVILAGDGNNTITASSDTAGIEITTGSGADTISLGSNLDGTTPSHIDAGAGANQITTGSGDFWVTVGSEADTITLNSASGSDLKVIDAGGANTIKALDGASFEITTGSGNDTITLGNDTAYDVSSVNHVSAGEGQNIVQVGSGSYVISAGDSADVITALSSAISDELVILAGDGNNTITASSDTAGFEITTGSGADTISLGSNLDGTTPSHIDAGAGANQITTGSGDFWVTVGSEADTITLNSASDSDLKVIDAGGANTIRALDGASFEITTGSGNDTITLGNDTAYDVSSVNHVLAGEGQNIVQVGSGSYVISAGDSADVITALSSAISDELVILAGGGNNTITSRSDTAGFEITTGSGDDTITLGGNLDVTTRSHIDAGAGANKISTGAGDFWVTVGSGGDDITLNSASGSDLTVIDSGGANQIKAQDASSFEITVGNGNDTITLGNDLDVSSTSVNHIDAGAGNNLIQAGNGNFVISTGSGIDTVVLGDGSNVINTGSGIAKITVGNGANQITTTEGNYDITAGSGSDIIHVGNGTTVNNGAIFSTTSLSGSSSTVATLINGATVTLTEALFGNYESNLSNTTMMSTGQTIQEFTLKRGHPIRELTVSYQNGANTQVYKLYGSDVDSLRPTVAALSDGGFAVAWQSLRAFQGPGSNQNYYEREIDIYLQRFSASGSVVQSVTQLTPSTPDGTLYGGATYGKPDPMDGLNQFPIIVPGVNGNFQVGWTGSYQQKSVTIGDPSNSILAGDGDNQITAGTGNVFITAGIGNDTILAGDGQITVNAGGGHNKITLGQGIYSVTALSGNDTVEGGNQSSTLTPSTVNVFTEKFNALTPPSTNNQVTSQTLTSRALQNLMPSSFAGVSWGTAASTGSMAVQRGGTDRALMIYHNDVAYVSVGAAANVAGQQYTLNFDFSTAADSVIGSSATDQLTISVLDQNNTVLSTKNVVPGAFGTALSNLKTAFTSDALTFTGNGQGELKIKIQGIDDSTTSFVGTVDNISVTQQSARNEINVGEGNNTITLGAGNFKVTAGAGTDVVTIGAGYSALYLGGGLSQQVNMAQNNGNQLISITTAQSSTTAQSGTDSYTANSYVKIMNFDIAASNAALLTGQATRKDLVQFVVKPNEIAGLLAGGATAPNWYLELVPDNPDTTGYTWSLNLKATLSGGNSITVSTIDFDWGSVDPLYGYTNYTLTYLQPKIDIGSGSFTYTTGLRYQPLNEVMDSAAVSASMGGGSNDTILLAALQTNVTGTPDTAVNVGAAIAAGARGGDVYAVRIQGTQAGLDNGIKTIVDSGNTSSTEEDAVYIEGIRSFSDLSFTRFQMINEGAKSLSIAYKQYLAAPDDQSVFASGKVNIFGEYNPSSPQYHIEKLQFSTATTQDGSNFLQAIQTYYLGEAKYDAARSVELHSVAGKANSLLVGTEDGSSIVEKFVIHTTVGATSEKEVRIYGFDSKDTIYFDGKVPTSVTSDAALSNMNGYTTDPHRLIVNFGVSDSLILMLDGTATLSNTEFDNVNRLLKFS